MKIFRKIIKNKQDNFELNEIFLDSKNLPDFDSQQFEGRIEMVISKRIIFVIGVLFSLVLFIFFIQLYNLQIKNGNFYFKRSQDNSLKKIIIFANRGIIYDRNNKELSWNSKDVINAIDTEFSNRVYLSPGFSNLLGYVAIPKKDVLNKYWQIQFIGKDGLEKKYNELLNGNNGFKIIEVDVYNNIQTENIVHQPTRGNDLKTTIDHRIQSELFNIIKKSAEENYYRGGAGIIMDINNGEIISYVNFPEYDSNVVSAGEDDLKINDYLTGNKKAFLSRAGSGLYIPGSIVKPFIAIGALNEGVINENKEILSTGSISIKNPYFPDQKTIFKDWKAHGFTNMKKALAVSSDVYFYSIGGGYEGQKGLGISRIKKYLDLFEVGKATGIDLPGEGNGTIPSPEWKIKKFNGESWSLGNTYHVSIGQYGLQVTPLSVTRSIAAIANYGKLITPHINMEISNDVKNYKNIDINIPNEYFDIVKSGMREAVISGTAYALNNSSVEIAAKTGTAEIGIKKDRINSWITGFFPYKNPKYAFTVLLESGPQENSVKAINVMGELINWMSKNTPEYFKVESL